VKKKPKGGVLVGASLSQKDTSKRRNTDQREGLIPREMRDRLDPWSVLMKKKFPGGREVYQENCRERRDAREKKAHSEEKESD